MVEVSSPPESSDYRVVIRRRRTHRHSRNRRIRKTLIVVVCALFTFGIANAALRHLSPSLFRSSESSRSVGPQRHSAEASREAFVAAQREALREIEDRPVYPYSIVPGGVRNAYELKKAAERDPVVRAQYAGFDYDHARVVRLTLARNVYLSYRIGKKVYWTRHPVTLRKGEEVITDGRKTARTKCGNRVEEQPQEMTSEAEPPAMKFEQPIRPQLGTALANPPLPFQSSLLNPGPSPFLPLSGYDPLGGGSFNPVSLPPVPSVCAPLIPKKPTSGTKAAIPSAEGKKKKPGDPCASGGGPGGEVPEPGTWLLMASGLSGIYWKYRHKFSCN